MISTTRSATKFSFILPSSFDAREFLTSPSLRNRWDDARYLIHLILTKFARRDVDERGLVRLMAVHLMNIMNQDTYAAVIDALRFGGVIERFPYSVGNRSFGFRLAERFVGDTHVRVIATDPRLIRRLERFFEITAADRDGRMKPIHRALASRQTRLAINGAEARRTLDALPRVCNPFDIQGIQIADIEQREFRCNVGRFGRVTNNITSLKRELRRSLHVEGEPLSSIDLSCAQPALLAKLIMEDINRKKHTNTREENKQSKYDSALYTDFVQFRSLVQSGEFYNFMIDRLRDQGISRSEFKRRFLADVLAKKGRYPSMVEDRFREQFPTVYQFVRNINRDDHASLIRRLQEAESQFVIETVAADFVSRHPNYFVIPLHDALYTTPSNIRELQESFNRGFERTGFRMRLKIEV